MSHSHDNFELDFLTDLGFDVEDPAVLAANEDSEEHARLIETLVALRKAQDLKQNVVADRMGTTQSRVSSFERISGDPRLSTVMRYARAVDARVRIRVSPHQESHWQQRLHGTSAVMASPEVDDVEATAWRQVVGA